MSNFDPYIFFNGNCEEAMKFYERTLGGKLNLMKAKDSPAAGRASSLSSTPSPSSVGR